MLTDPGKLRQVLAVIGKAMTVDNGGISLEDWIFAMRSIGAGDIMTIKTNNGQFHAEDIGTFGKVETLDPTSLELMNALRTDTVDNFVLNHSDWVSQS